MINPLKLRLYQFVYIIYPPLVIWKRPRIVFFYFSVLILFFCFSFYLFFFFFFISILQIIFLLKVMPMNITTILLFSPPSQFHWAWFQLPFCGQRNMTCSSAKRIYNILLDLLFEVSRSSSSFYRRKAFHYKIHTYQSHRTYPAACNLF